MIIFSFTEDFGFEHILFVYSGRRGIHCWICDEKARKLSQGARGAMCEYLGLVKGGDLQGRKVVLNNILHPSVKRALNILHENNVDDYVNQQFALDSEEKQEKFLKCIVDASKCFQNSNLCIVTTTM